MEKAVGSFTFMLVLGMAMATQAAAARTVPTAASNAGGLTDQKNFLTYGGVGGYTGLGGPGAGGVAPVFGGAGGIGGVTGPGSGGAAGIGGTTGIPGLGGIGGGTGSGVLPYP